MLHPLKTIAIPFSIVKVQQDNSKAAIYPCNKNLCLHTYILQLENGSLIYYNIKNQHTT